MMIRGSSSSKEGGDYAKNSSDEKKKICTSTSSTTSSSWHRLKDPRIVRVSRGFGGKDRHSKVCTVRGLRDRRVRLSVATAIQVYDLQDRLGLSQPSKVVDWLLNAAKDEIDELPPLQMPPLGFQNHQQRPTHEQQQQLVEEAALPNSLYHQSDPNSSFPLSYMEFIMSQSQVDARPATTTTTIHPSTLSLSHPAPPPHRHYNFPLLLDQNINDPRLQLHHMIRPNLQLSKDQPHHHHHHHFPDSK